MTFDFSPSPSSDFHSDFSLEGFVRRSATENAAETGLVSIEALPLGVEPLPVDMAQLGSVVGFQRKNGTMALSSWLGEAVTVWARMKNEGELPHLISIRSQIFEAFSAEGARPPGTIKMVCLRRVI